MQTGMSVIPYAVLVCRGSCLGSEDCVQAGRLSSDCEVYAGQLGSTCIGVIGVEVRVHAGGAGSSLPVLSSGVLEHASAAARRVVEGLQVSQAQLWDQDRCQPVQQLDQVVHQWSPLQKQMQAIP